MYRVQQEQQGTIKDLKESFTRLEQLLITTMSDKSIPKTSESEKDPAEGFWEWDGTYRKGPKDSQGPQANKWLEDEWTEWKGNRPKWTDHSARHMDEKHFRRIDKFNQGDNEWQEFCFDVMVTTKSINPELASEMERLTKVKKLDDDHFEDPYRARPEMTKASSELYEILCQLTGGQAKSMM